MEEDAAATTAVSLPDDVLLEILLRVKDAPAALFRCAIACKRWRRLVADLSFLRRCWPHNSFVGFIGKEQLDGRGEGTKGRLIPAPGSALGRGLRAIRSFVPALPAGAAPLVSRHRHGLLLARLDSDDPTVAIRLAVCNLHIGTCHVLPPLSARYLFNFNHDLEVNCYAVLSAADCRSADHDDNVPPPQPTQSHPSSFFKVVIFGFHRGDHRYHLHTMSSHETSWRVHVDCFVLHYVTFGFFSDVVVRHGTAHWFFRTGFHNSRFYVANLDTQTEHVSLTKLPSTLRPVPTRYSDSSSQCLVLASDGEALSLLRLNGLLIEVWGQRQGDLQNVGGTSEWHCTWTIKLKQAGKKAREIDRCLLGEKCGTVLVGDSRRRVYTADLKTGRMERVVDWPRGSHAKPGEVVPLEVDWATVFVSRLGTRKSRFPLLVFIRGETAPMSKKCRRRRQEVMAASQRRR